ncbi:MAG: bile acid:sodium symporter family protein [Pseudomonadota bacterium]
MRRTLTLFADPMIAVLIIATLLAILAPAIGEAQASMQLVSNCAIFALFLVNGMRIARGEIAKGLANWRFFGPLFLFVFAFMPVSGLAVSFAAQDILPPMVALGFVFLGALPSTIQSATSYTTLAGGNVALSVVGAALINIASVFLTAPLFAMLAGTDAVSVGMDTIVRIGIILILPFLIGQAVQGWTRDWVLERKARIVWLDRIVIGIAVYVAFSGAVEQGLISMFSGADWTLLIGLCFGFLGVGSACAWACATMLRFLREDRIAFLFAGPQKSVAIGAPLAAILFAPEVAGFVIAPLLIYHLMQLVIAAPLASWVANHQA